MKLIAFLLLITALGAAARPDDPELANIKIRADAGDPKAQDKLAQRFISRADWESAVTWYRKAAEQGYAHAQGQLGYLLLTKIRISPTSVTNKVAMSDEALKWTLSAAFQGDKRGQASLADIYREGKLLNQDFIEAYKWGELAATGSMIDLATITGRSIRDAAILKMSAEEIAEAKRRISTFTPHQIQKSEMPEPGWVRHIKLRGVSGPPERRLVVITGRTFCEGEEAVVRADNREVRVRCLAIRESSALVRIEGLEGDRELVLQTLKPNS